MGDCMSKELFMNKIKWHLDTFGKEKTLRVLYGVRYIMWDDKQIYEWCNEVERLIKYDKL